MHTVPIVYRSIGIEIQNHVLILQLVVKFVDVCYLLSIALRRNLTWCIIHSHFKLLDTFNEYFQEWMIEVYLVISVKLKLVKDMANLNVLVLREES